jgi:hypothetical protein
MGNNLVPEQRVDKNGHLVTRHVRQEAPSGARKPFPSPVPASTKSEAQVNAETVTAVLYAGSLTPVDEHLTFDEITPWMIELFPAKTLAIGAELLGAPTGNHRLNEWMMRGVLELSEDAYTEGAVTDRIREVLPRTRTRVEQAKIVAASASSNSPSKTIRHLLSSVNSQATIGVQKAINEGACSAYASDDDSDILRANVSLLMLNLVSPLNTRQVLETPDIYMNLDRIYAEMDRILPYLPEFQNRGAFSFEILEEMEASSSKTMIDGIL